MYLSVEKGMRGVIFDNAKRFNKANNKYMISYDNSRPRKYITYMVQLTYMIGQWVNIPLTVNLNGEIKNKLINLMQIWSMKIV